MYRENAGQRWVPTPLTNNYKCNCVTVKPAQSLQEGKSGQGEGALGQVCGPLHPWSPWQDSWTLVPKGLELCRIRAKGPAAKLGPP